MCALKTEFEKALLSSSKFVSAPPPPPPQKYSKLGEIKNMLKGWQGGANQVL